MEQTKDTLVCAVQTAQSIRHYITCHYKAESFLKLSDTNKHYISEMIPILHKLEKWIHQKQLAHVLLEQSLQLKVNEYNDTTLGNMWSFIQTGKSLTSRDGGLWEKELEQSVLFSKLQPHDAVCSMRELLGSIHALEVQEAVSGQSKLMSLGLYSSKTFVENSNIMSTKCNLVERTLTEPENKLPLVTSITKLKRTAPYKIGNWGTPCTTKANNSKIINKNRKSNEMKLIEYLKRSKEIRRRNK